MDEVDSGGSVKPHTAMVGVVVGILGRGKRVSFVV